MKTMRDAADENDDAISPWWRELPGMMMMWDNDDVRQRWWNETMTEIA